MISGGVLGVQRRLVPPLSCTLRHEVRSLHVSLSAWVTRLPLKPPLGTHPEACATTRLTRGSH
jgi:hypothetical protein